MSKKILPAILVLLILLIVIYAILDLRTSKFQIVSLSGAELYMNVSANSSYMVGKGVHGTSALPLYDTDLLYLFFEDDEVFIFYNYLKSDGGNLVFSWDGFRLSLNGEVIYAMIVEDPGVLNWLKSVNDGSKTKLRAISVEDDLPAEYIIELGKLADIEPELGLILETGSMKLNDLLGMFSPKILVINEYKGVPGDKEALYEHTDLEFLFNTNEELIDLEKLADHRKLKSLVIEGSVLSSSIDQIGRLDQVQRLCIMDGDFDSLDSFRTLKDLVELNLNGCGEISDLSPLEELTGLRRIGLFGCEKLDDLSVLPDLPKLEKLSIPESTTQLDFDALIPELDRLKILELYECDQLTSLDVLETIRGLDCLIVSEMDIEPELVYDLNHLSYLAFPLDPIEDSEAFNRLQDKLPNTVLVPSDAFCLGSGWLLLIIPIVVSLSFLFRFRMKKKQALVD